MEVEEIETFQQQALEITPPGDDFDPSKQPQSGEEYLMHMLYERKQCPAVVVKRPKKLQQNTNNSGTNMEGQELSCIDVLPDGNLLPTIEWKNTQSVNFIRTRSKIMMLRQHLAQHNYDNSLEPPMISDELAWLKFCQQHQPLLSIILRFNQRTLEQLLVMLSDWLKGERNDDPASEGLTIAAASSSTSAAASSVTVLDLACSDQWLGDWLYAVLACLHLPLEPNVHSTMRDIARSCMQLRSRLKSHEFEKGRGVGAVTLVIKKMDSPRFQVKINLKLEAITCPGVWLCSHGYLEVSIKSLGYFFRTGAMEPYFPLLCHDQFKIEGYFKNAQSIATLINNLSREPLVITLWQNGRRLAYYQGVIMDLLHHTEPKLQCPHINTRQLLMKPTPAFPGIISPKVEITSQFYVKDKILNLNNTTEDLRMCQNFLKKPQNNEKKFKPVNSISYQRPCTVQSNTSEDFLANQLKKPKQRTVCHARNFKDAIKKSSNESVYVKSTGRRVSIASSCSSNNTQTSVGICDLESDNPMDKFAYHSNDQEHEKFCELCRLYKEVFLQ